jgi:uncharacterized protein
MSQSTLTVFPRSITQHIVDASSQFPVVLVVGARQVGKTTVLRGLCNQAHEKSRKYVTLDDPLLLRLAQDDPALFLQRYPAPLLIDEVQYATALLPHIKMAVDAAAQANQDAAGMYWLTGSQPFHLMQGVSESLVGRVALIHMLGFSAWEAAGKGANTPPPFLPEPAVVAQWQGEASKPLSLDALYAAIWRGSFPALIAKPKLNRDLFMSSYLQTYLQRDVRDLARVGDLAAFMRFVRAAAARTGQLLNIADLARDADVSPTTGKHWLSVLEASGLIYLLQPWHNNVTKRLIKTPKLYFLDTGLCTYLTQWSSPQTLEVGAMSGAIFETYAIVEMLKSYWHQGREVPFYYYRNKDQREIDLLIEQDGKLYPIEIKKSANPDRGALQGIRTLEAHGLAMGQGAVLCMVAQTLPLTESVDAIPLSLFV